MVSILERMSEGGRSSVAGANGIAGPMRCSSQPKKGTGEEKGERQISEKMRSASSSTLPSVSQTLAFPLRDAALRRRSQSEGSVSGSAEDWNINSSLPINLIVWWGARWFLAPRRTPEEILKKILTESWRTRQLQMNWWRKRTEIRAWLFTVIIQHRRDGVSTGILIRNGGGIPKSIQGL